MECYFRTHNSKKQKDDEMLKKIYTNIYIFVFTQYLVLGTGYINAEWEWSSPCPC